MSTSWVEALPEHLQPHLKHGVPLADRVWFRVGGPAEVLLRAGNPDVVAELFSLLPASVPITVLGAGSNVLIREGGLPGLTVTLAGEFNTLSLLSDGFLRIGAGVPCAAAARQAAAAGIAGLEFLRGIPGTLGGAARMNAGCYDRDMAAVTRSIACIDRRGAREIDYARLHPTYRHTDLPADTLITGVLLQGTPGADPALLQERLHTLTAAREASQPVREKTGGSTFKNPPGDRKAWQLIDAAGCRGLRLGGALMSELHCNFMINTGTATASDLENLGETVRARVAEHTGVELTWEIERLGVPA